jgi:NADH:ubiquinone oxidoreductase subunit 5 (subunit L)/multisubunit Na+/H+ antiporter MnhA subunit
VAIAGLPPLNGFVSEWLLYLALLQGALTSSGARSVLAMLIVGAVSLVGALAGLAFVRLIGTALLGQPRAEPASRAHESTFLMVAPMAVLAVGCVASAIAPGALLGAIRPAAAELLRGAGWISATAAPVDTLARINAAVWIVVAVAGGALTWVQRGRPVDAAETWGCGYAAPTARMQYTARSFSETVAERLVPGWLRPHVVEPRVTGIFPTGAELSSDCRDPVTRGLFEPFVARWADRLVRLRWLQRGMLHVYLVYVLFALLAGLAWSSLASWSTT